MNRPASHGDRRRPRRRARRPLIEALEQRQLLTSNHAWISTNGPAASWANASVVEAIPGDFNGDGRTDVAFRVPGYGWGSVPIDFANGDGTWTSTNGAAGTWAHAAGSVALTGDFNGDGRTDIAFHNPGSDWRTVPVLLANGDGTWTSSNAPAPSWANEPGVVALTGDYDGDGRTDIAFHSPGRHWNTVPIITANGNGTWTSSNAPRRAGPTSRASWP